MLFRRFALAALAATLAPALVACGGGPEAVKVGDVIPARHADQFTTGTESVVLVPTGRLSVHLGKPVASLDKDETEQLDALTAPEGAVFVPITWTFNSAYFKHLLTYVGTATTPVVDLRIGDDSYRLPTPSGGSDAGNQQSFYVPVRGEAGPVAKQAMLSVAFDGVVQTADLSTGKRRSGRAAPLYRLHRNRVPQQDCAATWQVLPKGQADLRCRISTPVRLPYANGKWARKGKQFVVFSLLSSLRKFGLGTATSVGYYTALSIDTKLRINGVAPTGFVPISGDSDQCPGDGTTTCFYGANPLFAVDVGARLTALSVTQTYRLQLALKYGGYQGRKRINLAARTTITLPAAR